MAVKSGFDYMSEHEEKFITKVIVSDHGATIKWETDDKATGSITEVEPPHSDFLTLFDNLKEFGLTYIANKLNGESRGEWVKKLTINCVSYNSNSKGDTAKLKGSWWGGDGQACVLELPQTPLYNPEVEGHETGAVFTYGEYLTKALLDIQQEAKMYLGGKRGDMQAEMFEAGEEGEAEAS